MDAEARLHAEHPQALRLWLRMFACSQHIERMVRTRLRDEFGTTLPRFDLMAQLERASAGIKMNELSRRMMVSTGNVTGITDQLVAEGWVERMDMPDDRRAYLVRLTAAGRKNFAAMAAAHESWIDEAFAALGERESDVLLKTLLKLKTHAASLADAAALDTPAETTS
jgi:DNA-binding MarR family transcriptional regulator